MSQAWRETEREDGLKFKVEIGTGSPRAAPTLVCQRCQKCPNAANVACKEAAVAKEVAWICEAADGGVKLLVSALQFPLGAGRVLLLHRRLQEGTWGFVCLLRGAPFLCVLK